MRTLRQLILLFLLALLSACATTYPAQDPVGQTLPRVQGQTLEGRRITLPDDLRGRPTLLLILYDKKAQDDINYWAPVVVANMPRAHVFEVAAFTRFHHRLARRRLIRQARGRVPDILKGKLITLWMHSRPLARFTGSADITDTACARVLLLDEQGQVVHFCDTGFNHQSMRDLLDAYRQRWGPGQD